MSVDIRSKEPETLINVRSEVIQDESNLSVVVVVSDKKVATRVKIANCGAKARSRVIKNCG